MTRRMSIIMSSVVAVWIAGLGMWHVALGADAAPIDMPTALTGLLQIPGVVLGIGVGRLVWGGKGDDLRTDLAVMRSEVDRMSDAIDEVRADIKSLMERKS